MYLVAGSGRGRERERFSRSGSAELVQAVPGTMVVRIIDTLPARRGNGGGLSVTQSRQNSNEVNFSLRSSQSGMTRESRA